MHTVSRDWQTYSSERGGVTAVSEVFPHRADRGPCSSAWILQSTTGSRRCSRRASRRSGSPPTRTRSARSRSTCSTGLRSRETCDLVTDVAQPVVSRVIGSFMGIPPEDDAMWANLMNSTLGAGDPDLNPEGIAGRPRTGHPRDLRALPGDDRRPAREPDRRPHERPRPRRDRRADAGGARDRDGLLPTGRSRQRQHEGDLLQRDEGADGESRPAPDPAGRPLADSEHGRGGAADVPGLRALPPHGDAPIRS